MSSEVVQAVPGLVDYGTQEIDEIAELRRREHDAREEVDRIRVKLEQAQVALSTRRAELVKPDRSRELAAAALKGETPPPAPVEPLGPAVEDLAATVRGLEALRAEATKQADELAAQASIKGDVMWRRMAERIGPDLAEAAQRLEVLLTLMAATQQGIDATGHARSRELGTIVHHADWATFRVPSTTGVDSLRPYTRTVTFRHVLAGGDPERLWKDAAAALAAAKAEIRRRTGER